MAVKTLTIVDLPTKRATLDSLITAAAGNIPTTFDSYINPCFRLKHTQDCDTLILQDYTDYQELQAIDLNELTIMVTLYIKKNYGNVVVVCQQTIDPNATTVFSGIEQDGVYCAEIELSYVDNTTTYTKTIYSAYNLDCCQNLFNSLATKMKSKGGSISCTIIERSKIGRDLFKLKKSYLKLSNLLWVYNNSVNACEERDKIHCSFNKIK